MTYNVPRQTHFHTIVLLLSPPSSLDCDTPCPGDAQQQCGGRGTPSFSVFTYTCTPEASTDMPKTDCPQPNVTAPAVDDLCVMQPMEWYHGDFVQAKENTTSVGRARFSFNLCPGSTATVHIKEHDPVPGTEAKLFAFFTRNFPIGLTSPNTSSIAQLIYQNSGADPLWIMVLVTAVGDNIPSDASVDVKVEIAGDVDCAPESFSTSTMPETVLPSATTKPSLTTTLVR
jgi:hypothetical protein